MNKLDEKERKRLSLIQLNESYPILSRYLEDCYILEEFISMDNCFYIVLEKGKIIKSEVLIELITNHKLLNVRVNNLTPNEGLLLAFIK